MTKVIKIPINRILFKASDQHYLTHQHYNNKKYSLIIKWK